MRRKLAAAALAVGMFAVAGCGDDNGEDGGDATNAGSGSPEQICEELQNTLGSLDQEFGPAMRDAAQASSEADEEALAEATETLENVVAQITGPVRDSAERTDDQEFAAALRQFADALEELAAAFGEGGVPDGAAVQEASNQVGQYCEPGATTAPSGATTTP